MSYFTVVGVSNYQGQIKVRFANDLVSRVKILVKQGHKDVNLIELPQPMTKAEACDFLRNSAANFSSDPLVQEAIDLAWNKYNTVKVRHTKGEITMDGLRARAMAAAQAQGTPF